MTTPVGDAAIPSLQAACSPLEMGALFDSRVLPVLRPGERVERITIESVSYTPGHEAVILYGIGTQGATTTHDRLAVGTFVAHHAALDHLGDLPGVVLIPELRAMVEVFPADAHLPFLSAAVDPNHAMPRFTGVGLLCESSDGRGPSQMSVQVLRYRPHRRCILQYTVNGPTTRHLIGKAYRSRKRARAAWQAHQSLHAETAVTDVRFPRPLALIDDWDLVVMERTAGPTVRNLLLDGPGDDAPALVGLAAEALRGLHASTPTTTRTSSLEAEFADLQTHFEGLSLLSPEFSRRFSDVVDTIAGALRRCAPASAGLIHGDYTPSQLILDTHGAVTIVDFDRVALGDPALDVGNFMAKLVRDAVLADRDHLRSLTTTFAEQYQACADLLERARTMQSMALARIAASRFRQRQLLAHEPESEPAEVDRLLEEATSCLRVR